MRAASDWLIRTRWQENPGQTSQRARHLTVGDWRHAAAKPVGPRSDPRPDALQIDGGTARLSFHAFIGLDQDCSQSAFGYPVRILIVATINVLSHWLLSPQPRFLRTRVGSIGLSPYDENSPLLKLAAPASGDVCSRCPRALRFEILERPFQSSPLSCLLAFDLMVSFVGRNRLRRIPHSFADEDSRVAPISRVESSITYATSLSKLCCSICQYHFPSFQSFAISYVKRYIYIDRMS